MSMTLGQLAELIGGRLAGDANLPISGAATLDAAGPDEISFVDQERLLKEVSESVAAAVVLKEGMKTVARDAIYVGDPRAAFTQIVTRFRPPVPVAQAGISAAADISAKAQIGREVSIQAGVVIGDDVVIGDGVTIHANVTIMAGCQIERKVTLFPGVVIYSGTQVGARSVIHAGAVIGAFGFGYDTIKGQHQRGPQLGFVKIEADVEIGACTTIDRGTYGPTVIGEGTKIDNQVMIAHNCRIGKHNLICSQVGIAGSSSSGDYVVMAGQVGVPDHCRVGNRAVVGAKSGVMKDVPDDTTVVGIPATPEREQMAKQAAFSKLPEMRKQLRSLQRVVDRLAEEVRATEISTKASEAA
ncbi:MAG: UDP-3-O-(3-hydroxymyristoyl)glucosamine N-acyltransferase [Pirellulaceae bacterium]|nr:UDP-3-O-(3-hydroxymyristoyl)glucosamine N-acyltransferase [Pirellulaceae bacterium]